MGKAVVEAYGGGTYRATLLKRTKIKKTHERVLTGYLR